MKKIVFVFASIIFILLIPALLSFGITVIPFNKQAGLGGSIKVYKENPLVENLECPTDNISTIGMSLKNPSLNNKKELILEIQENNRILAKSTINGKFVPDGGFVKFKLDNRLNCKNRNIQLVLKSPDSNEGDALEVLLSNSLRGEFKGSIEHKPEQIALVFFTKPSSHFELIKSIYSDWWKKFSSDSLFAIIYSIVFLSLLASGTYLQLKKS